jgi:CheY-specific phosphatase CheX
MNDTVHPLKKVSLKVLEEWAMMLVDEIEKPTYEVMASNESLFVSSVHFNGIISGTISILSQRQFMKTLSNNLLGNNGSEDSMPEDEFDAFREMGNVLTGNFLTEAYGNDVIFELLKPSVYEISDNQVDSFFKSKVVFGFSADDAPLIITFLLD